jgi:hypothetical protein
VNKHVWNAIQDKKRRNKGFSTTQNIVIFRIDFNEGLTGIQLCNGKIDEKTNHLIQE